MITGNYRFLGKDGWYGLNREYSLTIRRTLFGRIAIEVRHGFEMKPYAESIRKYRNWEEFKKQWEKVQ